MDRFESTPARPIVSRCCSAAGQSAASMVQCTGMGKNAQASPGSQAAKKKTPAFTKPIVGSSHGALLLQRLHARLKVNYHSRMLVRRTSPHPTSRRGTKRDA